MRQRGFTIVELLVVVTVIVVLIAMLQPAMEAAVERAKIARCAANLHAFGIATAQYYLDHQGKILRTPLFYSGNDPYPYNPMVYAVDAKGDFNVEQISEYIGGFYRGATELSDLWYCPSTPLLGTWQWLNEQWLPQAPGYNPGKGWGGPIVWMPYFYFAHVEEFENRASNPETITERLLSGSKVLMSDYVLRYRTGGDSWGYNHGLPWRGGAPTIDGTNRLFGDASVTWKNDFDGGAMDALGPDEKMPDYVKRRAALHSLGNHVYAY